MTGGKVAAVLACLILAQIHEDKGRDWWAAIAMGLAFYLVIGWAV